MSLASTQSIITVEGRTLREAAAELVTALAPLPNARVVTLVPDINRLNSFAGRTTLLVVVDHD